MTTSTETRLDESLILGKSAHYICCADQDVALCGEDMSQGKWTSASVVCTGCIVNDNRGFCPVVKGPCTWGKDKYGDQESDGD